MRAGDTDSDLMPLTFDVFSLSFPDERVIAMRLDKPSRVLELDLTGAWSTTRIGPGTLKFRDWHEVIQRRFEHSANHWQLVQSGLEEPIKDICELEVTSERIIVRGFGVQSGSWLEIVIDGGSAQYIPN